MQVVIIAVYAHAYTAGDQLLGAPLSTKLSGLMPIALVRARTTPLRIVCSRRMCNQYFSDLLRRKIDSHACAAEECPTV